MPLQSRSVTLKFIIKFTQVIFLISLSVSSAYANFEELDQLFLEEGIVDRNYKYTDKKLAAKAFIDINNEFAMSLPIKINSYSEISAVFHSPSFAIYSYIFDIDNMREDILFRDFIEYLRVELMTTETTQDFCNELFGAKFQEVNGYTFLLQLDDVSGEKIIDITLDEKTCPLN